MQNLRALSRSGGIDRLIGPAGIQQRQKLLPFIEIFIAKVVNAGPHAEADKNDQHYWIREQRITNSDGNQAADLTFTNATRTGYYHVIATNLLEVSSETHNIVVDGSVYVLVFIFYDAGSGSKSPLRRFIFQSMAGETILRPGKITAVTRVDGPPSAHEYDGNFTDPAGGTFTDLLCLQRSDSQVIYLPMQVDDYVGVVSEWNGSEWADKGVLGGEQEDHIICQCDY